MCGQAPRPGPTSGPACRTSAPHVAIAFAVGAEVGIDMERLDHDVKPRDIASEGVNGE